MRSQSASVVQCWLGCVARNAETKIILPHDLPPSGHTQQRRKAHVKPYGSINRTIWKDGSHRVVLGSLHDFATPRVYARDYCNSTYLIPQSMILYRSTRTLLITDRMRNHFSRPRTKPKQLPRIPFHHCYDVNDSPFLQHHSARAEHVWVTLRRFDNLRQTRLSPEWSKVVFRFWNVFFSQNQRISENCSPIGTL